MKITITEKGQERELFSSRMNTRTKFSTTAFSASSQLKQMQVTELRFYGINYVSLNLEAQQPITLQLRYTLPGYWICFALEKECILCQGENNCRMAANQYTCKSLQQSVEIALDSVNHFLFINVDVKRFQGISVIENETRDLSIPIKNTLLEIRKCTDECPIQCIFIESKILSLFHKVLEGLKTHPVPSIGLSSNDIQKLRAAKTYIVKNLAKNYTLIELAHQVGLNDFKLKKGFKELFGSTVFTYRHSIRMSTAKNLLQSGLQVNEVSEEVGYKHAHHFSAAFKEYFDMLPSTIKAQSEEDEPTGYPS